MKILLDIFKVPYITKISKIKHSNIIIMIMTTSDNDDDDDDNVTMVTIKSNNIVFSLSVVEVYSYFLFLLASCHRPSSTNSKNTEKNMS